jgi:hypothetical protein
VPTGRSYVVSDYIYESGIPGWALNLNSTSYPDHVRYGDLPLQEKISTAQPGIEPETSWLVVRSFDHQTMRQVTYSYAKVSPSILFDLFNILAAM